MILKNGNLFIDGKIKKLDLRIENGIIMELSESIDGEGLNLENRLITPCFWDLHTHLRAPGLEYKEDPEETINKAIIGGYSLINVMPNTNPTIDDELGVAFLNNLPKPEGFVIKITGALTKNREGKELSQIESMEGRGIVGLSDDGSWTQDSFIFSQALKYAEKYDLLVMVHAQDQTLFSRGKIYEGKASYHSGLKGFPQEAEAIAILRDGLLAENHNVRLHFTHISTQKGLEALEFLTNRGVKITCDVTPHHLIFTEEVYLDYDTHFKANPPFATEEDRKALIKAACQGQIKAIATDHAPHAPHEKSVEWEDAPYGIASIDNAFSALYSQLVENNLLSLEKLISLLTQGPAEVLKEENTLSVGKKANLNVINLNLPHTLQTSGKAQNNPYTGMTSRAKVEKVILNGKIQFSS